MTLYHSLPTQLIPCLLIELINQLAAELACGPCRIVFETNLLTDFSQGALDVIVITIYLNGAFLGLEDHVFAGLCVCILFCLPLRC